VGCVQELDVLYKAPEKENKYKRYEVDGITVYLGKNIKSQEGHLILTIKRGMFFVKTIDIKGIDMKL
jgi:hypothetical protein